MVGLGVALYYYTDLGKLFNPSDLLFPHLKVEIEISTAYIFLVGLNKIMNAIHYVLCLAHGRYDMSDSYYFPLSIVCCVRIRQCVHRITKQRAIQGRSEACGIAIGSERCFHGGL